MKRQDNLSKEKEIKSTNKIIIKLEPRERERERSFLYSSVARYSCSTKHTIHDEALEVHDFKYFGHSEKEEQ